MSLILCGRWTCPQHPSSHNPLLLHPHSRALASDMLARLAVGYAHHSQASGASEVCSLGTFGDIFLSQFRGRSSCHPGVISCGSWPPGVRVLVWGHQQGSD